MTGAITRMGGDYYAMQGYVNATGDGPVIFSGGGVLIGETLYLTLAATQQHTSNDWLDTDVIHVQLNRTTLNGTFYGVGHDFKTSSAGPSPFFDSRFTEGTFTLSGPAILLGTSMVAPNSLLLLK